MNKIGVNDLCPCMSGKKYKKCCMRNHEFVDVFEKQIGAKYIDSNFMFNSLANNSPLLQKYFLDKLPSIHGKIYWGLNPNLNSNMRSMSSENEYIIIIKQIPIKEDDYFDVAHEIGHIIFGEQGYPSGRVKDGDLQKTYLCTILLNTIMDVKVNEEVVKYGFDFKEYMNKAISIQIPVVKKYPNELQLHLFDRHFLKCLLIEKILEWKFFFDNTINPFVELYKIKYPNIYNETLEDIKYINELGINTPDKVRNILNKLLEENHMSQYIEII